MSTWYFKVGDLRPNIRIQVVSKDTKLPLDITDADIVFSMIDMDDNVIVDNVSGVVDNGEEGLLRNAWENGAPSNAGVYKAEFLIDLGGNDVFRVPVRGYLNVIFEDSITSES